MVTFLMLYGSNWKWDSWVSIGVFLDMCLEVALFLAFVFKGVK